MASEFMVVLGAFFRVVALLDCRVVFVGLLVLEMLKRE
jgi:hypothetical protein